MAWTAKRYATSALFVDAGAHHLGHLDADDGSAAHRAALAQNDREWARPANRAYWTKAAAHCADEIMHVCAALAVGFASCPHDAPLAAQRNHNGPNNGFNNGSYNGSNNGAAAAFFLEVVVGAMGVAGAGGSGRGSGSGSATGSLGVVALADRNVPHAHLALPVLMGKVATVHRDTIRWVIHRDRRVAAGASANMGGAGAGAVGNSGSAGSSGIPAVWSGDRVVRRLVESWVRVALDLSKGVEVFNGSNNASLALRRIFRALCQSLAQVCGDATPRAPLVSPPASVPLLQAPTTLDVTCIGTQVFEAFVTERDDAEAAANGSDRARGAMFARLCELCVCQLVADGDGANRDGGRSSGGVGGGGGGGGGTQAPSRWVLDLFKTASQTVEAAASQRSAAGVPLLGRGGGGQGVGGVRDHFADRAASDACAMGDRVRLVLLEASAELSINSPESSSFRTFALARLVSSGRVGFHF